MNQEQIEAAKAIQRRTGRTFHLATRLLPERVRVPTYVLYGFFRTADEVVDGADAGPPAAQRQRLRDLRAAALGRRPAEDPVVAAFSDCRQRHGIDDAAVEAFLDAMAADVDTGTYETWEDLREYTHGSAAVVGEMMLEVMDPERYETALPHARRLGEAFQLTNFLRDVREDVRELGRIYLPESTLSTHGADPATIRALDVDESVRDAVRAALRRAEGLYREGVAGIRYLPDDCQFPVLLAAVLYAEHHRLIRGQDFDVVTRRPTLSLARSLWVAARTRWAWLWNDDPEAVFRRVSAIPEGERPGGVPEPADTLPAR